MARRSSRTSCSSSTASLGLKGLPDEHRIAFNDLRNLRIYAQFTADNRLVFAAAAPHITTSGRRSRPRTTPTGGAVLKSSADRLADVTEPAAGTDCRAAPNSTRSASPGGSVVR